MIGRLAVRSLTTHPVRSLVLATGFGAGVAVMAILLGVAQIVLQQAQSPALVGGGDVIVRLNPQIPAPLLLSGTLQSDALRDRVRVAAPSHTAELYLLTRRSRSRVAAHGGIPSLERELRDEETSQIEGWIDTTEDEAWKRTTPANALRQVDRFHEVPDAPAWNDSWAEWLYFNGRSNDARFYLTFLVGPRAGGGERTAGVRLQLERNGRTTNYSASARIPEEQALRAPDLTIGSSHVRLDGLQYQIHLDVTGPNGERALGDLTLDASPGRLVPPLEIFGARGWRTGYVVPVMSGALGGSLQIAGDTISFAGGAGYHDHNWGFWKDVSWQWGQVQHGDVSLIYGRVFPPPDAADAERIPGLVGVLGPDGPLGFATTVQITETNDPQGRPRTIDVRAQGAALDVTLRFDVTSAVTTRMSQGPLGNAVDFLQLQGKYLVKGTAGGRSLDFAAAGAAETFRGH
jgi:hypothetical protein